MTASAIADPVTTSADRMGFIVCLAAALHAAVILGVGFSRELHKRSAPRLEITLAQHQSANKEADFLAQHDQAGSGSLEEKALLTKREDTAFRDNLLLDPKVLQVANSEQRRPQQALLTTSAERQRQAQNRSEEEDSRRHPTQGDAAQTQLSQQIASLEARLDIQRQAYANRPKRRVLTSVSTKRAVDARYLHNWRTRIESIGNKHYPEKARNRGIEGELLLRVVLLPDGSIEDVEVRKSSGHAILDQAALRIVRLAAPYDTFPPEMAREVDILEIIRTWRFESNRLTSGS